MMRRTYIINLMLLLVLGCQSSSENSGDAIPFLEGTWVIQKMANDSRSFVETWNRENDSTFTGNGYILNSETGDRFNAEKLQLIYRNGVWVYSAQPNDAPMTDFTSTQVDATTLLFENRSHDFPQFIKYELISTDSLMVSIGDSTSTKKWKMVKRN